MKLYCHITPHSPTHPSDADKKTTPLKLVFLHGMGGTGALWRPIAVGLEKDCSILAPDQRGHGQSQTPEGEDFSPQVYGQDVLDTLKENSFFPTFLVGHSMGVRSALAAASLKPHWFKGLILVDLGLQDTGMHGRLSRFLKEIPPQFANREEARTYIQAHTPDPSIGQYLMAVLVKGSLGKVEFPFDRQALIQTLAQAHLFNMEAAALQLAQMKIPLLFLRGGKSLVWSAEDYEIARAKFLAYPWVEFRTYEDAGHGLPFEKRERFISDLRTFFGNV